MKLGDFWQHSCNNWQKSTWWLNGCHGYHTKAALSTPTPLDNAVGCTKQYALIFWEERTLKKGQILAFFQFFLKFRLACRKIKASQGFWYQGAGADMLFRKSPSTPICIPKVVPVTAHFPKFSRRLSPEIRASLEKSIFLGFLLKGLSNYVNFV